MRNDSSQSTISPATPLSVLAHKRERSKVQRPAAHHGARYHIVNGAFISSPAVTLSDVIATTVNAATEANDTVILIAAY